MNHPYHEVMQSPANASNNSESNRNEIHNCSKLERRRRIEDMSDEKRLEKELREFDY